MLLMIEKPRSTPAERGFAVLSRAVRAVPTVLDAILMGPFRALEERRILHAMAAMSDYELKDIGLNRGDIRDRVARDVVATPVGSDGSLFLTGRRWARRRR